MDPIKLCNLREIRSPRVLDALEQLRRKMPRINGFLLHGEVARDVRELTRPDFGIELKSVEQMWPPLLLLGDL
uniref:HDC13605 n=1 Tax=Drosophila melanogaster TaxID=7227 RepID=Q6IK16_DROME|nr:TPA_inf: HDC13605 [Drosophila melanogaster]